MHSSCRGERISRQAWPNWRFSQRMGSTEAILKAHDTGQYGYSQFGVHFSLHFTTVARIVRSGRQARRQADGKDKRRSPVACASCNWRACE